MILDSVTSYARPTSEVGLACETMDSMTGKLGTLDLTFWVLLGPGTLSTATPQTTLPTATFRVAASTQFTLRSCRYCHLYKSVVKRPSSTLGTPTYHPSPRSVAYAGTVRIQKYARLQPQLMTPSYSLEPQVHLHWLQKAGIFHED